MAGRTKRAWAIISSSILSLSLLLSLVSSSLLSQTAHAASPWDSLQSYDISSLGGFFTINGANNACGTDFSFGYPTSSLYPTPWDYITGDDGVGDSPFTTGGNPNKDVVRAAFSAFQSAGGAWYISLSGGSTNRVLTIGFNAGTANHARFYQNGGDYQYSVTPGTSDGNWTRMELQMGNVSGTCTPRWAGGDNAGNISDMNDMKIATATTASDFKVGLAWGGFAGVDNVPDGYEGESTFSDGETPLPPTIVSWTPTLNLSAVNGQLTIMDPSFDTFDPVPFTCNDETAPVLHYEITTGGSPYAEDTFSPTVTTTIPIDPGDYHMEAVYDCGDEDVGLDFSTPYERDFTITVYGDIALADCSGATGISALFCPIQRALDDSTVGALLLAFVPIFNALQVHGAVTCPTITWTSWSLDGHTLDLSSMFSGICDVSHTLQTNFPIIVWGINFLLVLSILGMVYAIYHKLFSQNQNSEG